MAPRSFSNNLNQASNNLMAYSKNSVYERSRSKFTAALFVGDLAIVFLSLVLGYFIRFRMYGSFRAFESFPKLHEYWDHALVALVIFTVVAHNQKLYRWSVLISRARTLVLTVRTAAIWSFSVVGASLMLNFNPEISRLFMLCSVACFIPLFVIWRFGMHAALHKTAWLSNAYRKIALVGTGANAKEFAECITSGRAGLYKLAGFIKSEPGVEAEGAVDADMVVGSLGELDALARMEKFNSLLVCDPDLPAERLMEIAKVCERNFVDFKSVPRFFEAFSSCLSVYPLGHLPVMGLTELPQNRVINRVTKRAFDIFGALFGLLLTLPLYAILIPLLKKESPGPAFYKQTRAGQGGKPFEIYKIRSMKTDAEVGGKVGWSTENDPRRTRIGTFMRKWNIDEIPQFWNVLKGEMSLVGPRPERPELIADFLNEIPYYQSRHSVKPGMTGWAQVNGLRGDTSISERIRYDLQYIENWSVWMDISIQFKTIFNYKGAC